jgi:hypothetical protein
MDESDKTDFSKAVDSLRRRLEPCSKTLAAQEFRRVSQGQDESIADCIRRLEKMFRMAYGRDKISVETRDALLFSQMQEGLKYELMVSPAVSGATEYRQLCLAARNEEKRLLNLDKRRKFLGLPPATPPPMTSSVSSGADANQPPRKFGPNPFDRVMGERRCCTWPPDKRLPGAKDGEWRIKKQVEP